MFALNRSGSHTQGSTAEGVIAMLDSSYGALTDQSTFYVEISRVLTDNVEQLVRVLADNNGERSTAIDAPHELEPEEESVWSPRAEWEARREVTVLFLVDDCGEPIGCTRELAGSPDLPALTQEVVDGLLAYDRDCREGGRAEVEFLGLLDVHDAGRRGLDVAGGAISRRLGLLAALLAVGDAVLDFNHGDRISLTPRLDRILRFDAQGLRIA